MLSKNKGADQLCSCCAAELQLYFWHMKKSGFLMMCLILSKKSLNNRDTRQTAPLLFA